MHKKNEHRATGINELSIERWNLEKGSWHFVRVEIGSAGMPNFWAIGCVNAFQGPKLTQN
jgi:hypothetical protein